MAQHNGFTMNGIKDPIIRKRKLIERQEHIDNQIRELEDKKWLISHEINLIDNGVVHSGSD